MNMDNKFQYSTELYEHGYGVASMLILQVDSQDYDQLKEIKEEIEILIKNKENNG